MKKIKFINDWAVFFKNANLNTFKDFISYSKGTSVNKNSKRDVVEMTIGSGDETKIFYMKRFFSPHYKDMLFAFCNFGRLCTQAELEYKNAKFLLDHDIDTYHPVCFGKHASCGIEKASFVITEKIKGQELTEFVTENFATMSSDQKVALLTALGKFVRKIHDAKISMLDLYLWHIFVTNPSPLENNEYDFAVIDLHRMSVHLNCIDRIKNLGAFDFSMTDKYFDDDLRKVFIKAYAKDSRFKHKSLYAKARRRSNLLNKRRRRPEY
jgi:tRNA A-37 threonylcarbamoyl transferase component Bud32